MKSNVDKIETPAPCEHCGGSGKISAAPPMGSDPGETAAYGNKTCPVCGGSGKAPAPTVEHSEKTRKCFVATAAFGDPDCQELVILRRFRDEKLLPHKLGRKFVSIYYAVGPSLAKFVERRPALKKTTRRALSFLCRKLSRS